MAVQYYWFTSIKRRISGLQNHRADEKSIESFVGIKEGVIGIPFKLKDYIELVDWTGRIIRKDKRGHIDNSLPNILDRLSIDADSWKILTTEFEEHFQCWVGSEHIVTRVCEGRGYQRKPSTQAHQRLFS